MCVFQCVYVFFVLVSVVLENRKGMKAEKHEMKTNQQQKSKS